MIETIFSNNISTFKLIKYKNEGLVPCYFDDTFKKLVSPVSNGDNPFLVYLLPEKKYNEMVKLNEFVQQRIKDEYEKIETLKNTVPAVLDFLTK
jgi:hypothetical protein